jgi:HEAT repeat protein
MDVSETDFQKHMDNGELLFSIEGLPALPKKHRLNTLNIRCAAVEALVQIGAPAAEILILTLQDGGMVN